MNKKAFALSTLIMLLIVAWFVGLAMTKWVAIVTFGITFGIGVCGTVTLLWCWIYEIIEHELRMRERRKK